MLVKLEVPESQKFALNITVLKELFQRYGYKAGKRIKPTWVEDLMHELDPYTYYLEWDVPEPSLRFATDILKLLKACPKIPELTLVFPSGTKFIIKQNERAVEVYARLKEEL